ncbi:hypothetical protein [Agathobacter ruminis]|uniref:hypothetical protein n=1 Tax=Agathobacter ruminis TaxID=1712665 RepID=UPI001670668B|nr:hypothetical protein [Agathobacter ruminis]MDC7300888.1 hypothetical protein [Agathobacter ruminis]
MIGCLRGKDCAGEVQKVERTASFKEAACGFAENLASKCPVRRQGEAAYGRRERRGCGVSEDCEWGRKFGIIEGVRELEAKRRKIYGYQRETVFGKRNPAFSARD